MNDKLLGQLLAAIHRADKSLDAIARLAEMLNGGKSHEMVTRALNENYEGRIGLFEFGPNDSPSQVLHRIRSQESAHSEKVAKVLIYAIEIGLVNDRQEEKA